MQLLIFFSNERNLKKLKKKCVPVSSTKVPKNVKFVGVFSLLNTDDSKKSPDHKLWFITLQITSTCDINIFIQYVGLQQYILVIKTFNFPSHKLH